MPGFLDDLKAAVRSLRNSPGYTVTALLTLGLGIAASTTVFSVVRAVLLRPLPYRDPDRLVTLLDRGSSPLAPADFLDFQKQTASLERMASAAAWSAAVSGTERVEQVPGMQFSEGMFEMLGVPPLHGRTPAHEEYEPGNDRVVVLGYAIWQRLFGADPAVIGRTLRVNGSPYVVIGVMPPGFRFAPFWVTNAEVWAPLTLADKASNRAAEFMRVFARLRPGATLSRAQSEIRAIAQRLAREYPDTNAGRAVQVDPLGEQAAGKLRPALLVLAGAVALLLLTACSNVAALALSRAVDRRREIAIKVALGAGRARIVCGVLTESVLLAAGSGAAGTVLSWRAVALFRTMFSDRQLQATVPAGADLAIDGWVLAVAAGVSVLAGLLFGLSPALEALRADVNSTLLEGGRAGGESRRSQRLRSILVVAEVAISVVLLAGGGLLARSFLRLRAFEPGFQTRDVLTMVVSLASRPDWTGERREAFYRGVEQRLLTVPGVLSASMVNHLPVGGDVWGSRVYAEGQPVPGPGRETRAVYRVCRPGYFETIGIRLAAGRDFTDRDRAGSPAVAVVNQSLANRFWPAGNPIGRRIAAEDPRNSPRWLTVVGVVRDAAQRWSHAPDPEFYVPFEQDAGFYSSPTRPAMTIVIRTSGDPLRLGNTVRAVVREIGRDAAVSEMRSMEQVVSASLWQARLETGLLGAFALFAVLLSAAGMYGVVACSVARRTRDIGVRMALGARRGAILWLVVRRALALASAGVGAGMIGAFAFARSLDGLLYATSSSDAAAFGAVPVVLLIVAAVAAWVPARRASAIDPACALRRL